MLKLPEFKDPRMTLVVVLVILVIQGLLIHFDHVGMDAQIESAVNQADARIAADCSSQTAAITPTSP